MHKEKKINHVCKKKNDQQSGPQLWWLVLCRAKGKHSVCKRPRWNIPFKCSPHVEPLLPISSFIAQPDQIHACRGPASRTGPPLQLLRSSQEGPGSSYKDTKKMVYMSLTCVRMVVEICICRCTCIKSPKDINTECISYRRDVFISCS